MSDVPPGEIVKRYPTSSSGGAMGWSASLKDRIDGLRRQARRLTGGLKRDTLLHHTKHPAVPHGTRVYAVGDIHGRVDLLDQMLDRIESDLTTRSCPRFILIFLGDYIDRGPESAHVLDRLIQIKASHHAICLRGNHEALFSQFLEDPATLPAWAGLGGLSTLMSYGLQPPLQPRTADGAAIVDQLAQVLPDRHRTFLATLPPSFVCGDYFFVHAGIRPRVKLARQSEEDLLWIRDDFLLYDAHHEKMVVHGHTPVMTPDVRKNRINIDTGAFATGRLTCLVLDGEERRFL